MASDIGAMPRILKTLNLGLGPSAKQTFTTGLDPVIQLWLACFRRPRHD